MMPSNPHDDDMLPPEHGDSRRSQSADRRRHGSNAAMRRAAVAAVMLVMGIIAERFLPFCGVIGAETAGDTAPFAGDTSFVAAGDAAGVATAWRLVVAAWYAVAFLLVGVRVMREAVEHARRGDIFTEFTLMSAAAIGAFAIGEWCEAVAVLLLYVVGESLQDGAVRRARGSIASLMAFRPDRATVVRGADRIETEPDDVAVGTVIEVAPGCRVPIDGALLTDVAAFDTSALTGEAEPRYAVAGDEVLAGFVVADRVVLLRTLRPYGDSAAARILRMVDEASARKAPTELFIRRFARVYTPSVFLAALLLCVVPAVVSALSPSVSYVFAEWFRRSLVFLVISCPCALVIGVPLAYYAGIGAASHSGILFKGGGVPDALAAVDTVVFDKTGTLTTGEFAVDTVEGLSDSDLSAVASVELSSSHPVARAVVGYARERGIAVCPRDMSVITGRGVSGGEWLIGTVALLEHGGVAVPGDVRRYDGTLVAVAHSGEYRGCIRLSDTLKDDACAAVAALDVDVHILSGDRSSAVAAVAARLGVSEARGELLPEAKVAHIAALQRCGRTVAFVGDGINDAPVLARSDVGIAMGSAGADAAVEIADVVLRGDKPSLVPRAIAIARHTRRLVRQNIVLAIGIKVAVMVLALCGIAVVWLAVVADSGAAVLCVLNAVRPLRAAR